MAVSQTITTITYDGQFWIALIERRDGTGASLARHVFGAEPSNAELLAWAGQGFENLGFVPSSLPLTPEPSVNPKRRKREAAAVRTEAAPSRSRDALKAAAELRTITRKGMRKAARHEDSDSRRRQRAERRKARRNGKA